jgi:molybdate/tungstate transport system substrate-binding protein
MLPALEDLEELFEASHPGITVNLESGGSSALTRKVTELGAPYDAVVLADVALFDLLKERGWTDDFRILARDRMVLAHAPRKKGVALGPNDWRHELGREQIRFGMADPSQAPLGYRTILVLQLEEARTGDSGFAERIREKAAGRFVWPHATALAVQIEAGEIDYAFLYSSQAKQLRLSVTELADEVNLGSPEHARDYSRASVEVVGNHPGVRREVEGAPIAYGAATNKARRRAVLSQFADLLFGPRGADVLRERGLTPQLEKDEPIQ